MDPLNLLTKELRIPRKCCRSLSEKRFVCLVQENWVKYLRARRLTSIDKNSYPLTEGESQLLLARSYGKVDKPWHRVSIKVIPKEDKQIVSLIDESLVYSEHSLTVTEVLGYAVQDRFQRLCEIGEEKYSQAATPNRDVQPVQTKAFNDVVRAALLRIHVCPVFTLSSSGQSTVSSPPSPSSANTSKYTHANISPAICIIETQRAFYLIQSYVPYTLWDAVVFSPALIEGSNAKPLFILYQILKAVKHCHSKGISVGDIHLNDIFIDTKLWVMLCQPNICRTFKSIPPPPPPPEQESTPKTHQSPSSLPPKPKATDYSHDDLPTLVQKWTYGEMSNFDYLMALNHLAGRRMGDPNHHPILPWLMDFTSETGGYRDLTMSKYRLNKGDAQLDLTYDASSPFMAHTDRHGDPLQIPHHVSDMLSDITFLVYRARRVPKAVLCQHVRTKWVPAEYPSTMERMQQWTPDECIPEFFTDPEIFSSIHDDLGDLEVPPWCTGPEDFVRKHMAILEGEYVSQRLHHWIDLTFGYKLSGTASVKAKNVCLQLVDKHTNLMNHGVVPLFHSPHPVKRATNTPSPMQLLIEHRAPGKGTNQQQDSSSSGYKGGGGRSKASGAGSIVLPAGYDPLELLDQLEALHEFSLRSSKHLPPEHKQEVSEPESLLRGQLSRDVQAVGCLVMELVLSPRMRTVPYNAPFYAHYKHACSIAKAHPHEISRPLRQLISLLLQTNDNPPPTDPEDALFLYPRVDPATGCPMPTMDVLLSAGGPVLFPAYMPGLYDMLNSLKHADAAINAAFSSTDTNLTERHLRMRRLAKDKVMLFARYLKCHAGELGIEGLELLMPYMTELFEDAATAVQAAWCLFNPMAQALGTAKTAKLFLPLLTSIFDDESTTPKHMKLYHRTYIIQLIVRLGLECFLSTFSTLLVEASAGYKNFTGDDFDRQISNESDMMEDQANRVSDVFMEGGNNAESELMSSDEHDNAVANEGNVDDVFPDVEEAQEADDNDEGDDEEGDDEQDPEESSDSASMHNDTGSLDAVEDISGKSLGRVSVHSVSRLIEESLRASDDSSNTSAYEDKDADNEEDDNNGPNPNRSPSPDNISNSELKQGTSSNKNRSLKTPGGRGVSQEEEFTRSIMDQPGGVEYNISDVAGESIKWLAHRLGPVLTGKYLSRNLLRMLALCYLGQEQMELVTHEVPASAHGPLSSTEKRVVGDLHAAQVLECLACIAILYGEQFIQLQYFTHLKELVREAQKKLTLRAEASLVGCVMLLIHIIPYISDSTLMDILQENLIGELLLPLIKMVSALNVSFPSGPQSRRVLCYKLIDLLAILSLRIGFEMTRQHMTSVLQMFFVAFNKVYENPDFMDNGGAANGATGGKGLKISQKGDNKSSAPTNIPSSSSYRAGREELYEIKMDTRTQEYKVEMPFCASSAAAEELRTHRRTGSGGSLKQYSLSPPSVSSPSDNTAVAVGNDKEPVSKENPSDEKKDIQQELKDTFTPELAHLAYIPFCKLAGGIHMEQNLINDDLIRQLCSLHDQDMAKKNQAASSQNTSRAPTVTNDHYSEEPEGGDVGVSGSFGTQMAGNKIMVNSPPLKRRSQAEAASIDFDRIRSPEMEMNKQRHLRGNWLAYWEHQVGRGDYDDTFNVQQIKLQTFQGHSNSVRALYALDNENSFISASKDKTIKLWSLRSSGDGSGRVGCQWSYAHKKSVFAVTFIESIRLAASCDGTVHIWDPFTGECVGQVENSRTPVTMICAMPTPYTSLLTATSDAMARFLDVRTGKYMYEFKCCTQPAGAIRCGTVSADGSWVALGFATGYVSVLEVRTGMLLVVFKAHEGEILQIKAYNNKQFVTSTIDGSMTRWNYDDGKAVSHLKGPTEAVHCFNFYSNKVVSATTANKIGVHSSLEVGARFTNTKLKSDVFRGMLTTMEVLPLNRLLLLGSDSGTIKLLA